jgi:LPXTG-motif cell wall-anchored protein
VPPTLPQTGTNSSMIALFGLALMLVGGAVVGLSYRRRPAA